MITTSSSNNTSATPTRISSSTGISSSGSISTHGLAQLLQWQAAARGTRGPARAVVSHFVSVNLPLLFYMYLCKTSAASASLIDETR